MTPARPRRLLKVAGLGVLAGILLFVAPLVTSHVAVAMVQSSDGSAGADRAELQRTLVQMVALNATVAVIAPDGNDRVQARSALVGQVGQLGASHHALVETPTDALRADLPAPIEALYGQGGLDADLHAFIAAAHRLVSAPPSAFTGVNPDYVFLVAQARGGLATQLDRSAALFQDVVQQELARERTVSSAAAAGAAAVVLAGLSLVLLRRHYRRREQAGRVELAEARDLIDAVFYSGSTGAVVTDMSGRFLLVNDAACDLVGYSRPELLGMTSAQLAPPDRDPEQARASELLRSGRAERVSVERPLVRRDGTWIWALVSSRLVSDPDGTARYVVSQVVDVTAARSARLALAESQQWLETLFRRGAAPVVVCDLSGRFVRANDAACAMLGYDEHELCTRTVFDVTYAGESDNLVEQAGALVSGAVQEFHFEGRLRTADGTPRFVVLSGGLLRDAAGEPMNIVGQMIDITDRHKAEEALQRSRAQYREVVELQSELLSRLTPDGRVKFANPAYLRAFGLAEKEAIGHSIFTDMPPAEADLVKAELASRTPEDPLLVVQHVNLFANGARRWLNWRTRAVFDGEGRVVEYLSVGRDVTEQVEAERALAEREQQFRTLLESSPLGIGLLTPDARITYINQRWTDITGQPIAEALDYGWARMMHPEDRDVLNRLTASATTALPTETRYRVVRDDGSMRWIDSRQKPLYDTDGAVTGYVCTVADITAEIEARAAADRLIGVLDATTDTVAILHRDGTVLYANQSAQLLLGGTGDGRARALEDLLTEESVEIYRMDALPGVKSNGLWRGELTFCLPEGLNVPMSVVLFAERDSSGALEYLSLTARDITDLKSAHERLAHLATHDGLTGLPNRMLLVDRLSRALERAWRSGDQVAVLFCDLDGFKVVNDSLGHDAGDEVLTIVAARIQGCLRASDTAARLGGDEFVVLCDGIHGPEDVIAVAARLIPAIERPVIIGGHEVRVGTSIGVAFALGNASAEEVLMQADVAMYRAKAEGKGCYRVFEPAMWERDTA